jgi:hypothetical protein
MKNLPRSLGLTSLASVLLPLYFSTAAFAQPTPPPDRHLAPNWSNSYDRGKPPPEPWRGAKPAFSYDGSCIAIAGGSEAQVISRTGRTLWKWKYGAINRFIVAGLIAVSPACDALAIGGDSSYKYVWIAEKNGHKTPIPVPSTPVGAAFSRDGKSFAVGTGSARLYLFTRDGKQRWSTPPYSVSYASDIAFSSDNKFILVRQCGAIVRVDGSIVGEYSGCGMSTSTDLRTIVTSWQPPHGPGPGHVTAQDEAGKEIWSNFSDDPGGVITPDGERIIARVNIDQEPPEGDTYEPRETALRMFSHDGKKVDGFPNLDGRPVAISPDGKTMLLETNKSLDAIDLTGKRLYSIAVSPSMYTIAPDFSAVVVFSTGSDGDLEYFKLP